MLEFAEVAARDIDAITDWYSSNTDEETTVRAMAVIVAELDDLAVKPLLGNPIPNLPPQFRRWLILRGRYYVYYERLAPDHIKVLRIYNSRRRRQLSAEEILRARQ